MKKVIFAIFVLYSVSIITSQSHNNGRISEQQEFHNSEQKSTMVRNEKDIVTMGNREQQYSRVVQEWQPVQENRVSQSTDEQKVDSTTAAILQIWELKKKSQ